MASLWARLLLLSNAAVYSGLLDSHQSEVLAAYSTRRLLRSYKGDCCLLRRDDDEEAFGFDKNGNLMTASIASWLGAASGYLKTFYDQSGGGHDMTQITATKQPLYVASAFNSRPAFRFDGSDDLLVNENGFLTGTEGTAFAVYQLIAPTRDGLQVLIGSGDEAGNTRLMQLLGYRDNADPNTEAAQNNDDGIDGYRGNVDQSATTPYIVVFRSDGSEWLIDFQARRELLTWLAGANSGDWFGDTDGLDNVTLGALKVDAEKNWLKGDLSELFVLSSIVDNNPKHQLEDDQNTYWGVGLTMPPKNAGQYQAIPTYEGSGQAVHPDVYDAGEGAAQFGYRYWMAMTPFPGAVQDTERPSVVASQDGHNWEVPSGLTNPIYDEGSSDTDLILAQDGKFYLYHRDGAGGVEWVYVHESADGVTWSAETAAVTASSGELLSPAVIWDGAQYVMWVVDRTTNPNTLRKRTSASPAAGWSAAAACTMAAPVNKDIWHLDVILHSGTYHAFVTMCDRDQSGAAGWLYHATSADGDTWIVASRPLLVPTLAGFDNLRIYRASAIKTATGWDVWYSSKGDGDEHRISRIAVTDAQVT